MTLTIYDVFAECAQSGVPRVQGLCAWMMEQAQRLGAEADVDISDTTLGSFPERYRHRIGRSPMHCFRRIFVHGRRRGVGSQMMKTATKVWDEDGTWVWLTILPDPGMSKTGMIRFFRRWGFVLVYDGPQMVRPPVR